MKILLYAIKLFQLFKAVALSSGTDKKVMSSLIRAAQESASDNKVTAKPCLFTLSSLVFYPRSGFYLHLLTGFLQLLDL
ncbi:hypothetical protein FF1_030275 [Malus domestica]